jgi:hypothetical protein
MFRTKPEPVATYVNARSMAGQRSYYVSAFREKLNDFNAKNRHWQKPYCHALERAGSGRFKTGGTATHGTYCNILIFFFY